MARNAPPNAETETCALVSMREYSSGSVAARTSAEIGIDPRDDRDDDEREDDPHAEDGDRDAPGDEAPPPDRVHLLQHGGVHDGVVERQRDLEDREHRD